MLSCPHCGGVNPDGGSYCQFCGATIGARRSGPVTTGDGCPSCGAANPAGTNFCHSCGGRVGPPPSVARLATASAGLPVAEVVDGPANGTQAGARLVAVRRDGTDGNAYPITAEQFDVGRSEGDLLFDDPHMAARHARITYRNGQYVIVPLESRNGIYVRIHQPVELVDGDHVLLGKQVLRFEVPLDIEKTLRPAVEHGTVFFGTPAKPPWGRLRQVTAAGTSRDIYHLTRSEVTLGREQGDVVFSDDEFLSRRHAQLHYRAGHVTVLDLGSSNGTFVRLRGQHLMMPGELVRMGDELLRFEIG
jgi:pSer/pThr/pTyr-binding forkhead associated (FHA) protein